MKKIVRTAISTALLIACIGAGSAIAHQGHDVISSDTALSIANKSVKQLTFKDLGYDIGKLDASWKSVTDSDFSVTPVFDNTFIVSVINTTTNEIIVFEIAKTGKVLAIKPKN